MAGRPTDYRDEYCEQVEKLCKLGLTDKELGGFFEVEESTINNWKIAHPEFLESIKAGKEIADGNVASSLYKRATGYEYDEVVYERIETKVDDVAEDEDDIKMEVYKKKVTKKELPPDPTSMIFWLKNRQKKKWRDKIETGFTDADGNDVQTIVYRIPDNGRKENNTGTAEGLSGENVEQPR